MTIVESYPEIDYGKLIYHYRAKTGVTQNELALGICSIPYLSKLENGKLESTNNDTVQLLMKRLNVDLTSFEKEKNEIQEMLEDWYKFIKFKNIQKAKEAYLQLEDYFSDDDLFLHLTYWFKLFEIRYFLLLNELETANELTVKMSRYEKNLSEMQYCYFIYFTGILRCIEKEYSQGLTLLSEAEAKFIELKIANEELFYHLALTHSYLNNITLAIYYGEKALKLFNKLAFYPRSIDCQLILAINYTRVQKFEEAKKYYSNLLEIAKSSGDDTLTGKILNNLGYLYAQANDSEKAINYFVESLNFKHPEGANYGNTIYGLVEVYLNRNDIDNAVKTLNDGLEKLHPNDITNKLHLTMKRLEINKDSKLKDYLEDTVIPFFQSKDDHVQLCKAYEKLAHLYATNFYYKKSSYYYSLAIKLHNKLTTLKGGKL